MLSPAEDIEICIAYLGGVSIKAICDYYLVSPMTIHRSLTRHGLSTERGKRGPKKKAPDQA